MWYKGRNETAENAFSNEEKWDYLSARLGAFHGVFGVREPRQDVKPKTRGQRQVGVVPLNKDETRSNYNKLEDEEERDRDLESDLKRLKWQGDKEEQEQE